MELETPNLLIIIIMYFITALTAILSIWKLIVYGCIICL